MKPILDKEIILNAVYLKQKVIDIQAALLLLQSIHALKDSPFPVNSMTVNFFRGLIGAAPHPDDERGNALLTAPDVVKPGDDVPTAAELQAAWDALVLNKEGAYQRGELHKQYPELVAVLQIPDPTQP